MEIDIGFKFTDVRGFDSRGPRGRQVGKGSEEEVGQNKRGYSNAHVRTGWYGFLNFTFGYILSSYIKIVRK